MNHNRLLMISALAASMAGGRNHTTLPHIGHDVQRRNRGSRPTDLLRRRKLKGHQRHPKGGRR